MQTIFENDIAKSVYDDTHQLIMITWKAKSFTFQEYKEPFEVSLDYQEKNKLIVVNFLSDVREQTVVPPHFRKWFQEVAINRAISQGLKRAAVIMSGNVFKKYYLNNIFNTTKKFGLPLKAFSSIGGAYKWFDKYK